MKILHILEILKDKLWTVQYENEGQHIICQLQENWTNSIWLQDFFDNHESDLKSGFYGDITVDKAIEITIDESERVIDLLQENEGNKLDVLFKPLDNREFETKDFQKQKAKGEQHKTWLRIYAIKFGSGYVITGGTIKLTKTMQKREHTKLELMKLDFVRGELRLNKAEYKFVYLD